MVDVSITKIIKKLNMTDELDKKDQSLFKKLSKRYPVFIPFKIINLMLSKKFNTIDYDDNLEICATQISDRKYLYQIIDSKVLSENQKFEIFEDLKDISSDSKKTFIEWIKSAKPTVENLKFDFSLHENFELIRNIEKDKIKSKKIKKQDYMTETLAELYIEQKKFKEALKAYEILSLKYPEKISLFANQIIFLKKKLNNV